MNTLDDLHWRIEKYEVIITDHENTATKQIEDIWASTQPEIDAAREAIRRQEALIARIEADREAQKADILSVASMVTEPTRFLLASAKHQLAAISAPILRLPTECIAEIMAYFNVDNSVLILLLVSKRWNAIATATPRLWSKIVLYSTSYYQPLRLKGAHICKSLEHLSFVLSLAKNVLLDIELACSGVHFPGFMTFQNPAISGDLMMDPMETDRDWHDKALRLLGADGQSRRWRSLHITSWNGVNSVPFTVTNGLFDNLRSLYIHPLSCLSTMAYEPLVTAIVQEAPRLSAVNTNDLFILQRVQGWKDRKFWRKIESYHSLAACDDWSFLSHAHRLTDLSLCSWNIIPRSEPVFLPSLRSLRLRQSLPEALGGFRLPALETIFLDGSIFVDIDDPIPVLSVTSIIFTNCADVRNLRRIFAPNLYHLHISCLDYVDRRPQSKAWQSTFTGTFDGSRFMPRPISLHLELPISENQLLSALLLLPQIEELKIMPLHPLGTKFWSALTPRGVSGRKKAKQYCPKLRIMVVEIKMRPHGTGQALSRARTMELGIEMALAREQEGQPLTHLLFSWDNGSENEVLGSFTTLPLYPLPELPHSYPMQYAFY
jgi:hypothetical protein